MIVGEAHVIVRAITTGVRNDIQNAFNGIDDISTNAGKRSASGFQKGFGKGSFFGNLAEQSESARKQFDALLTTSYTLGPAIVSLVGAVSSLVGGLAALAGAAAGAAPALIVLPGLMLSAAQAAGTLKLAFMGVAAAISAGTKAQKAQGTGSKAVAKDLTAYYRRIADTREALIELNRLAIREIEGLNREVAQNAAETAAIEIESANRVIEAKNEVTQAQLDLNDAYEQGAEEIQQLNFAAEDAVIGEKKAALELEKARDTLLRVQDLPPNSRARKEAELAFAQADLNYRKAMDSNKDISKEQDRLAKEGVDGTSVVIGAKKKLVDAVNSQAKAEVDAQNEINDSRNKGIELQRQLAENAEDHTLKQYKAIQDIKRAEEDLERARKSGGASGAAASNAYQQALNDLSPPAQKFVKFMVDKFVPSIKTLRDAAAKEFFPKLINAMTKIKDDLFPALVPMLEKTGGILGTVSEQLADAFTNPDAIGNIEKIWSTNDKVIADFGIAGSNAINAVLDIFVAAGPIIKDFSDWIVGVSEKFSNMIDTEAASGDLTTFFTDAGKLAAGFKDVFSNTFSGIGTIIRDLMKEDSGAWMLLEFFKEASKNFKDFTNNNTGRIREFFQNTAKNSIEILTAVGKFVKEFLKLGENKSIGDMAKTLGDLAPQVGDIAQKFGDAGPSMANFITKLVEFVDLTTESGAIQTFWDTLSAVTDVLISFFRDPVVASAVSMLAGIAAAMVALRLVFGPIKMVVMALINPFYKFLGFFRFLQPILLPFLGNFGAFVSLLLECGPAALTLVNPMVWVAAAVAGAIAAFIAMWRESEIFREAIKKLVDGVLSKAVQIFEKLKKKLDDALKPLGGMGGVVDKLKVAFKFLGDIIGTYVIPFFEAGLKNALEIIGAILGTIIDTIGNLIAAFAKIWEGISTGDIGMVFEGVADAILAPFKAILGNLIDLFVGIFNNIVDAVKKVLGIASPSQVFTDIATAIFDALKNVLGGIVGFFVEIFTNAWNAVFDYFTQTVIPFVSSIPSKVWDLLTTMWDIYIDALRTVWDLVTGWFTTTAIPWLTGLPARIWALLTKMWDIYITALRTVWGLVTSWFTMTAVPWITGLPAKITNILKNMWNVFSTGLTTAWGLVKSTWSTVTITVGGWVTSLSGKIKSIWDGFFNGLVAAWEGIKKFWNNLPIVKVGLNIDPPDWVPGMPDNFNLKFPGLAKGGVVAARPGGTLAVIGEAGRAERVEPLDSNGLSKRDVAMINLLSGGVGGEGLVVNVYPSPGMNEVEIASIVSREISFQMRRGSL